MGQDGEDREGRAADLTPSGLAADFAREVEGDRLVEAALPYKLAAVLSGLVLVVIVRSCLL